MNEQFYVPNGLVSDMAESDSPIAPPSRPRPRCRAGWFLDLFGSGWS